MRTLILDFNDTIDDNFAVKKEALTHVLKKFSADDLSIKKGTCRNRQGRSGTPCLEYG